MIRTILLIIALSLDAFSFGLAQGFKNNKIKVVFIFLMSILSTVLFAIPLFLSQFIFHFFNKDICNIINGSILTLLGLYYFIKFIVFKFRKLDIKNVKNNEICLKFCILSTFPISLDAIFTAFLNGYSLSNIIFAILTYFLFTFVCIFVSNFIALKLSKKSSFDLSWLSGFIFIILGLLKTFGI